MNSSPHHSTPNAIPRKSFRRTLLRPVLHNFSAFAPVNLFDGVTYRPNRRKTRKPFRRLLLPLFVPVSPLGAHSYENIGVWGVCAFRIPMIRIGTPPDGGEIIRQSPNYLSYLSLTSILQIAPKNAQCFLSLTDTISRNYQCCLPLTKKGGGEGQVGTDRAHP